MGSLRVGHDWATSLSLFTFMHWRRQWQPTPVFLPGESLGQGSLVGFHLWGRTEWLSSSSSSYHIPGLPWWLSGKESACRYRRCGFDPWVGKIPWRKSWQLIPVFLGRIREKEESNLICIFYCCQYYWNVIVGLRLFYLSLCLQVLNYSSFQ